MSGGRASSGMWHDTTVSDEILIIGGGVIGLAMGWRFR
jgi:pyruvate/2-oxoglutarate dehydrogenase complex dihydrolipoamide dehydrogenase (E3) component